LQWDFLDLLRATAVRKVEGLDRALAVHGPIATSPSLTALGVIKHLTAVERHWICIVGGGLDLPSLWEGSPDPSWRVLQLDTPSTVIEAYRTEWAVARRALYGKRPGDVSGDGTCSVRWILAHVIQETARHVGHLDLLRELADGQVGE
jgi:uncharacterized damage-inducible protein DinB